MEDIAEDASSRIGIDIFGLCKEVYVAIFLRNIRNKSMTAERYIPSITGYDLHKEKHWIIGYRSTHFFGCLPCRAHRSPLLSPDLD